MLDERLLICFVILALCALSCQAVFNAIASPTPLPSTPTPSLDLAPAVTTTPTIVPTLPATVSELISTSATGWGDWQSVAFTIQDDSLWSQTSQGSYAATGSQDTTAWSDQVFDGDLMISLDIESHDSRGQGTIIVNGNGLGWSKGNLVFIIGSGEQSIKAHTYEGMESLQDICYEYFDFTAGRHRITIEILDDHARLFVDEKEIGLDTLLDSEIKRSGKIGLFKSEERPDVTYSNIQVKFRTPPSIPPAASATSEVDRAHTPTPEPTTRIARRATPVGTNEPGRIYEPEGGFSYVPPKGWKTTDVPGLEYKVVSTQVNDFFQNIFFIERAFSGSLDEFVAADIEYDYTILKDLRILSREDFWTADGERGVKLIIEHIQDGKGVHQALYFFDAGAKKFVATFTRLAGQGQANDALVDESMRTFRVED